VLVVKGDYGLNAITRVGVEQNTGDDWGVMLILSN